MSHSVLDIESFRNITMKSGEPEDELRQEGKYLVDGETKYSPYFYSIWFSATDLTVSHSVDPKGKRLVSKVSGSATIEGRGIELIGLKGKGSTKLNLSIEATTSEE